MDSITKFNDIDYANTFAKRISVMHELVRSVLPGHLNNGDCVIDLGGGPGIGAKIIDGLGIEAMVINIEPSETVNEIPRLSHVNYIPLRMTFKEALGSEMPCAAGCLLVVSSEHEIALCNGRTPDENKKIYLNDLHKFIRNNLRKNGTLIFGFPCYREGASDREIEIQRRMTESLLGHSHPREEFFTLEEFSAAFGEPIEFIRKPMNLALNDEDTILMANVAVFKK